MIQPLRTVHRRAFVGLALVLPAIFLVGLGARHSRERLSAPAAQLPNSAHLLRKSDTLWQKQTMRSEFYSDANYPGNVLVVLSALVGGPQEANAPDLLLYWAADQPQGDVIPANAKLLGAFITGKVFTLPTSPGQTGYLVLFSLPHHTVFDTAKVETFS